MKRSQGTPRQSDQRTENSSSNERYSRLSSIAIRTVRKFFRVNVRCASCAQYLPHSTSIVENTIRMIDMPDTILCERCRWVARYESYFCCGYCTRADHSVRLLAVDEENSLANDRVKRVVFCCTKCLRSSPERAKYANESVDIELCSFMGRSGVSPRDDNDTELSDVLRRAAQMALGESNSPTQKHACRRATRTVSALIRSPSTACYQRYLNTITWERRYAKTLCDCKMRQSTA